MRSIEERYIDIIAGAMKTFAQEVAIQHLAPEAEGYVQCILWAYPSTTATKPVAAVRFAMSRDKVSVAFYRVTDDPAEHAEFTLSELHTTGIDRFFDLLMRALNGKALQFKPSQPRRITE